ncbi:MAG TPA: hypothetical protein VNW23_07700 [Opitutaceae bacterium]|jgi:hypothetical protein|nr:hypothetical protein [Opitutaceae bacterium]
MKKLRKILAVVILTLSVQNAHAFGVLTFDIQSFLQQLMLKAIGQDQVSSLNQLLGVNDQQLSAAKQICSVLGDNSASGLANFNLSDLQTVLKGVPGLGNVNIASLFPPGAGSAFLGLSFNNWQSTIGNPSSLFATQLAHMAVGDIAQQAGLEPDESGFLSYLATPGNSLAKNQANLALSVGRLLTSHLLESVQAQAQQAAVYATQKQQFDDQAKQNLTLVDRAKLNNNQNTLSLDMQLQQMQAQSLGNSAQAAQLDAQNQLLQQQMDREDVDRAARLGGD